MAFGDVPFAAVAHGYHRLALGPAGVDEDIRRDWRSHDPISLVLPGIEATGSPEFGSAHRIVTGQTVAAHDEDFRSILCRVRNRRRVSLLGFAERIAVPRLAPERFARSRVEAEQVRRAPRLIVQRPVRVR